MQARHLSGMPIDHRIWTEDPPSSPYPACLAVKAAELQSALAGSACCAVCAIIVGHRPYDALLAALARAAPDLAPVRRGGSRAEYEAYSGRSTEREVDEAVSVSISEARGSR